MIVYGSDEEMADWASLVIFGVSGQFKNVKTISILKNSKIICVVLYNNFYTKIDESPLSIEMSIASVDKSWATRHNLRAFFSYPFIQLGLERVSTHCSISDGDIMNFNKRLGFVQEGVHRSAWPAGGDSVSFSMLKNECRWING